MKKMYFLFILIFVVKFTFAQIKIIFYDNQIPIPYVTVLDTNKNIIGFTDKNGSISVPNEFAKIFSSHISFYADSINLLQKKSRETFKFDLRRKEVQNEAVFVNAKKLNKKRFYKAGYYDTKKNSGLVNRLNTLMGIKIANKIHFRGVIRSIKFSLWDIDNLAKRDFVIEIKIYALNANGNLSENTLNQIPIYLSGNQLKKTNEILLGENIKIPHFGIFFSVELPAVFDDHYDWTINYTGSVIDEPTIYNMKNRSGKWDELSKMEAIGMGDKYLSLNFGYTYWQYEF